MTPQEMLTYLKQLETPRCAATLDVASWALAYCRERGLSPIAEVYFLPTKTGWQPKEHYTVQARWAQAQGGYSTPIRETDAHARGVVSEWDDSKKRMAEKEVDGVRVRVGLITNRDQTALMRMAQLFPEADIHDLRDGYIHYAEAFVPNSHTPPAGKDNVWVARKRAEEAALREAFGKEPSQSRALYGDAMAMQAITANPDIDLADARRALYGSDVKPPVLDALPSPVDGEYVVAEPVALTKTQSDPDGPHFTADSVWVNPSKKGDGFYYNFVGSGGDNKATLFDWKLLPTGMLSPDNLQTPGQYEVHCEVYYTVNGNYKNVTAIVVADKQPAPLEIAVAYQVKTKTGMRPLGDLSEDALEWFVANSKGETKTNAQLVLNSRRADTNAMDADIDDDSGGTDGENFF